jgi:hypothetical protein
VTTCRSAGTTGMSARILASDCPYASSHTPGPAGYVAASEWAERMLTTHSQHRCPGCGLYQIWLPHDAGESRSGPSNDGDNPAEVIP